MVTAALYWRLAILCALFVVELVGISIWLDTESLVHATGLAGLVGHWGAAVVQGGVVFAIVFVAFGYRSAGTTLAPVSREIRQIPIAWPLLVGHFSALIVFGGLSLFLFDAHLSGSTADLVAGAWLTVGFLAIALAISAFVPPRLGLDLVASTGNVWVYALLAGILSPLLGSIASRLWESTTELTFRLVGGLLRPFVSDLVADPATHTIGSQNFSVEISRQCSGLEGAGLMLVFGALWLWFFRREFRFPHAFWLIPVGVFVVWLANSFRIAALILIGNAGAPDVAVKGFHSQAGWITFNAVALGFSVSARRLRWLRRSFEQTFTDQRLSENPAAPYLIPFLVILATAMISRAVSSGFEWLYPLRFFAAAAALWFFWKNYKGLGWRVGWISPVVGILVFALWVGLDRIANVHQDNGIGTGLESLTDPAKFAWLACRTLAAVVTVPIAEELAFRGFLIRRLISSDFASLSLKTFTWFSVLISSAAFGLMHGNQWQAGSVAGLLYSATLLWRGSIGDAILAHATTNALLAALVLFGGNWHFW